VVFNSIGGKSPSEREGMRADILIYYDILSLYVDKQYTSIRITKELREILSNIGRKNETYEDVIRRLVKEAGYDIEEL